MFSSWLISKSLLECLHFLVRMTISWLVKFPCKILRPRHHAQNCIFQRLRVSQLSLSCRFQHAGFPIRCVNSPLLCTQIVYHISSLILHQVEPENEISTGFPVNLIDPVVQLSPLFHHQLKLLNRPLRSQSSLKRALLLTVVCDSGRKYLCSDNKLFSDWTIERRTFFIKIATWTD